VRCHQVINLAYSHSFRRRKYNDIASWHWTSLLKFFSDDPSGKHSNSYTVTNKTELSKLLDDPTFASAEKIQLVEVMMHKFDAPRALKVTTGFDESLEN
jgi:pyruvate decarboxylase